jgi:hypothetical protein
MKRVPLNSPEGRRLVERGPAWREHPDYFAPDCDEDIPWHTEDDVQLAATRIRNHLARLAGPFNGYDRRARDIRDALLRVGGEELLADLARVALGMKPH